MNIIDVGVVAFLFVSFPIGVYLFSGERVTLRNILQMCMRFEYHWYLLFAFFLVKTLVLLLEEPVEGFFSMDLTRMIHDVENNNVLWFQRRLLHPWMTVSMIAVYVGSFFFIFVFSFAMFAYLGKLRVASDLIFLYWVLLILTIPFYFFIIVYVPSYPKMLYPGAQSVVMGMEPLLYNYSPSINEFFIDYDTFNNCFPSMHIGYPCAVLFYLLARVRGFIRYKIFLFVMLILISIAILYLGIHWIIDIFGGVTIAFIAFGITDKMSRRCWERAYGLIHRIERYRARKGLNLIAGRRNVP